MLPESKQSWHRSMSPFYVLSIINRSFSRWNSLSAVYVVILCVCVCMCVIEWISLRVLILTFNNLICSDNKQIGNIKHFKYISTHYEKQKKISSKSIHPVTIENQNYMMMSSNGNIFPRYWPFVRWIHRSLVTSPHKGQWRGALLFSLIWTNGWVNNEVCHISYFSYNFVWLMKITSSSKIKKCLVNIDVWSS